MVLRPQGDVRAYFQRVLLDRCCDRLFHTIVAVVGRSGGVTFFGYAVRVHVGGQLCGFIDGAFVVELLRYLGRVYDFYAGAICRRVVYFFRAFPAFVTVRYVVTAGSEDGLAN